MALKNYLELIDEDEKQVFINVISNYAEKIDSQKIEAYAKTIQTHKAKLPGLVLDVYIRLDEELEKIDPGASIFFSPEIPQDVLQQAIKNLLPPATSLVPVKVKSIPYATDKVMEIFNLDETSLDEDGEYPISTNNKYPESGIVCGIDFDNLPDDIKISKKLTPFDRRIHDALCSLWEAWEDRNKAEDPNDVPAFSYTQLHRANGGKGKPSKDQTEKYNAVLKKFRSVQIRLSNETELQVKGNRYPKIEYEGSLIMTDRIKVSYHGQVGHVFQLYKKPILFQIAEERGHISKVNIKVYQVSLNSSAMNDAIFSYLLRRIIHMKNNSKVSKKILYATLFSEYKIEERYQIMRAKKVITRILGHWKKCNFIKNYIPEEDGITIVLYPKNCTSKRRIPASKNGREGD